MCSIGIKVVPSCGRREGRRGLARCEGNGQCVVEAPEVFALDDEDELVLFDEEPPESSRANVDMAVRACPKRALAIEA